MLTYQLENTGKNYAFRANFHAPCYVVPPHIHEYSELLWVQSGAMTLSIDGVRHVAPAKSVVFICPNQIHEYTRETLGTVWCTVFSNDFLANFYQFYPDKIPKNPIVDFSADDSLIRALSSLGAEEPIARVGLLNLLFAELLRQTVMIDRPAPHDSLFRASIDYVNEYYREDVTLADMARALGYHEKYLSSKLHQLTGMNFRMFLATYRVDAAKRLLATGSQKIDRIAMECGFGSINTFNRVFRAVAGVTPSEYRNNPSD